MRFASIFALFSLSLWTAGCGDPVNVQEPGLEPIGTTVHLLDEAPIHWDYADPLVDPEVVELLQQDWAWILDESISGKAWMADGPVGRRSEAVSKRWIAKLRYPRGLDRCVLPIDELNAIGERELRGSGRDRATREGEAALLQEGALSLLWPRTSGRPPETLVSYRASSSAVYADVASPVSDLTGFLADTRILGHEARRVLAAPSPWSTTWEVEIPSRAQLRFGWGIRARQVVAQDGGLKVEPLEHARLFGRVTLQSEGQDKVLAWEGALRASDDGQFFDVGIDLEHLAGQPVRISFEFTGNSEREGLAPLALLAEPLISFDPDPELPLAPNVVMILVDTLRADRLGCYGWERAHTPNMDRLAERGVRYSNLTSAAPWTLPSHASLFSSLYVSEHGIWDRGVLSEEAITVAEVLRDSSYATGAFTEGAYAGKSYGLSQGFDQFQTGRVGIQPTLERAKDWISQVRGPFFAFIQSYEVHAPYNPPDSWRAKLVREYDGKLGDAVDDPDHPWGVRDASNSPDAADLRYVQDLYDAEIAFADDCIGGFVEWMEEEGLMENTVIILTSDHGEEFNDHGHYGHGWSLYREMLHVPLILYGPGRFEGGQTFEHGVHGVDLAPTIASIAGAPIPETWSGLPLTPEPIEPSRAIFTPFFTRLDRKPAAVFRLGNKKFVCFPEGVRKFDTQSTYALYDTDADPHELNNLFADESNNREGWIQAMGSTWELYPERFTSEDADVDSSATQDLEALGYLGGE